MLLTLPAIPWAGCWGQQRRGVHRGRQKPPIAHGMVALQTPNASWSCLDQQYAVLFAYHAVYALKFR
jgi:hypothetical protein